MMIEKHYSDETLIAFLEQGDPASMDRDPHLASCGACGETLSLLRSMSAELQEESVWDLQELSETPNPNTIAYLRDVAAQMADEDAAAEHYVRQLLAGSRDSWAARLTQHPEWRTAGVVRKLIDAVDHAVTDVPEDALALTSIAIDIAEALNGYPSQTVIKLSAAAWRERGYVLMFVGRYAEAAQAARHAEEQFAAVDASYDEARVRLTRALIERDLDHFEDAATLAASAAVVFEAFGDEKRTTYSDTVTAMVLYSQRDYTSALKTFLRVADRLEASGDVRTLGTTLQNIACCYRELRDFDRAISSYTRAVAIFEAAGMSVERIRARWHIARLLAAQSRYKEAEQLFATVATQFDGLGLMERAALVRLDGAEVAMLLGRHDDVAATCRMLVAMYQNAGLAYTERALTALAFLQEAVAQRRANPQTFVRVRTYLEQLPAKPKLLFAEIAL